MMQVILKVVLLAVVVAFAVLGFRHYANVEVRDQVDAVGSDLNQGAKPEAEIPSEKLSYPAINQSPERTIESNYDPVKTQIKSQDRLLFLDNRLGAEPMSPEWAARSEHEIRRALSPDHLAEFNASAPSMVEIICKSTTCRISMAFDDPVNAPDAVTALTTGIASSFPEALIIPIQGDGVQYHVFATSYRGGLR